MVRVKSNNCSYFVSNRKPVPIGEIGIIAESDSPNVRIHQGYESAYVVDSGIHTAPFKHLPTNYRFRAYDCDLELVRD